MCNISFKWTFDSWFIVKCVSAVTISTRALLTTCKDQLEEVELKAFGFCKVTLVYESTQQWNFHSYFLTKLSAHELTNVKSIAYRIVKGVSVDVTRWSLKTILALRLLPCKIWLIQIFLCVKSTHSRNISKPLKKTSIHRSILML